MVPVSLERRRVALFSLTCLVVHAACGMADAPDPPSSSKDSPPGAERPFDDEYPGPPGSDLDRHLRLLMGVNGVEPPREDGPYDRDVVELGRKLFFDKALSANKDVACSTCHHTVEGVATGDGLALGVGVGGRGDIPHRRVGPDHEFEPRHSLELFNLGLEGWETQFWDGRLQRGPSGELVTPPGDKMQEGLNGIIAAQAMLPVTSRVEMRGAPDDSNPISKIPDEEVRQIWSALMDRLLGYEGYRELFRRAYPDKRLGELKFRDAANAIAQFEKSAFTFLDSPFDRYLRGKNGALTKRQKRGAIVFYGKGGCASCHSGTLTTDQEFHNLAVPQLGPGKGSTQPLDPGRYIVTGRPSQLFDFRTPPLRNCELTPPYMHNGAYKSIEGVIEHHLDPRQALTEYDGSKLRPDVRETLHNRKRTQERLLKRLDEQIRRRMRIQNKPNHPLRISQTEVDQLVAFLRSMTSPTAEESLREIVPSSVPSGLLDDGTSDFPRLRVERPGPVRRVTGVR